MDDSRILESIGKLSGLVEASREDIKTLVLKNDEQSKSITKLATSIEVIQNASITRSEACQREFKDIRYELELESTTIADLKNKALVADGVEKYKGKKREWWHYTLGVIGAIIGILIGINQLYSLVKKIDETKLSTTNSMYSTYAGVLVQKQDSLFKKDSIVKIDSVYKLDSIKLKGK